MTAPYRIIFDQAPNPQGAASALGLLQIYNVTQPTFAIGELIYTKSATELESLAPNTTTTQKFLGMTGTGSAGAAPVWEQPTASDLSDYAATTWTPALTFATPGDLSVAYSTQAGTYTRIGRLVFYAFEIITSTFTHSTASGNLRISGLPLTVGSPGHGQPGAVSWQGITKAGYTDIASFPAAGQTYMQFFASASGSNVSAVTAANMPTAGTVDISASGFYIV